MRLWSTFTTVRTPEDGPCHKIIREILKMVINSCRDEEDVPGAERTALTVYEKRPAAAQNNVKLILFVP